MRWFLATMVLAAWLPLGSRAATPAVAGPAVQVQGDRVSLRHEKLRLANGFEVILIEDHRLPLVAFNLWVHAGPQNEAAGQTGFAHLFEHLMFAGTRHIPRGEADKFVDAAGGTDSNGSTSFDRTNYYFTLPSNQLELGLWIKSDMLGYMIDQVDAVALKNQQDVVRNERRQTTENRPYGIVDEAIYEALYPPGHPYRAVVIGSHADIQSIRLDDVRAFARTYYRPNNATLVLAGDFEPAEAKRLLQKYFGPLKAGPPVPPPAAAAPRIESERRLVVTDRIELPRLTLAWHTPKIFAPGDAELDLTAGILGGGKSSRLYKKLVYETQIAQAVTAAQSSAALGSVFSIEVVARPGHTLEEIEQAVDAELAALVTTPPTADEVQRARAAFETQLFARIEKIGGLADLVNAYNQDAGDPDFLGRDLARYRAVTPEAVRAAVATHLRRSGRVSAQAVPGDKVLAAEVPTPGLPPASSGKRRESMNADAPWRARKPAAGPLRSLALPAAARRSLPNGLTVLHVPRPGVPLVSATLVVRAGQDANPVELPGLAGFTAQMLQEGTRSRSAQQLADDIANLGATLTASAGREDARIELSCLSSRFPQALGLLADVALHPAFDNEEIERRRKDRLAALLQQREQPTATAGVVAARALYGAAHPLGASPLGDEAAIAATDRQALQRFWQARYRPDEAALVVVGDVSAAQLDDLVARLFEEWQRPEGPPPPRATGAPQTTAARVILVDKPAAPQTALVLTADGPRAADARAPALDVLNAALGGLFTSRINMQLREVKGYTYGARSAFTKGRDSGNFSILTSVRSDVTGAALADVFKEVDGVRSLALPTAELDRARNALLLSLPGQFETNAFTASRYAATWALGLPDSHVTAEPGRLRAVTSRQVLDAARGAIDPSALIVVAVGDGAKIGPQIQQLGRVPVQRWDLVGRPLP